METECLRAGAVIREDYRILVKCEVEIRAPKEYAKALLFYQKMASAAVNFGRDFLGEQGKKEYAVLPDLWAKARFLPYRFRLYGEPVFEDSECFAIVCNATFLHGGEREIRRTAQVWSKRDQTILPNRQVLRRFCGRKLPKTKGFRADGCYPENGEVVLFRNSESQTPFTERKILFQK